MRVVSLLVLFALTGCASADLRECGPQGYQAFKTEAQDIKRMGIESDSADLWARDEIEATNECSINEAKIDPPGDENLDKVFASFPKVFSRKKKSRDLTDDDLAEYR